MFFVLSGAAIGLAYKYSKSKGEPEENYPQWMGKKTDDKGQNHLFVVPWMLINEDGKISSKGEDHLGKYTIEGGIKTNGTAEFKQKYSTGRLIEFDGRVKGPNKIAGIWKVPGESYGTFELEAPATGVYSLERDNKGNIMHDQYPLHMSKNGKNLLGIGMDSAGLYLLHGVIKNGEKMQLSINYPTKFSILVNLKAVKNSTRFEGKWEIEKAGKGTCKLHYSPPVVQGYGGMSGMPFSQLNPQQQFGMQGNNGMPSFSQFPGMETPFGQTHTSSLISPAPQPYQYGGLNAPVESTVNNPTQYQHHGHQHFPQQNQDSSLDQGTSAGVNNFGITNYPPPPTNEYR